MNDSVLLFYLCKSHILHPYKQFSQKGHNVYYKASSGNLWRSLLLLQSVEVVFGLEFDLDVSGGQFLVDGDNGFNLFSDGGFFVLVEEAKKELG